MKYRELQCHDLPSSAPERQGVAKRIVASQNFSEELTRSIKRIGGTTASLVGDIEALERAYKCLYAISYHHQGIIPQKLEAGHYTLVFPVST